MPQYLHPGVYIEEVLGSAPIQAAPTSIAAFVGVTEKGPIASATLIASFEEYRRRFGGYIPESSELTYAVQGFFLNGGSLCYIVRLAHYADPADRDSITAAAASTGSLIQSTGGVATAASVTGTGTPTFSLTPGDHIDIDVDNAGVSVATFDAARATRPGAGLAIADLTGLTLELAIDGGPTQTVTFAGTDTTPALVAAAINTQIEGGFAAENGGEVDISSDTEGTGSSVEVVGGTALAEIGHTAGTTTGTGDVADIDAVTFAEVKTVLEADIAGLTVSQASGGQLVLTSDTTGAASEIDIDAASTAALLAAFGLTVGVVVGSAAGTQHCLTIAAADEGLDGNNYSVQIVDNPVHTSQGAGSDLESDVLAAATVIPLQHGEGLQAGVVIQITDGVNTEYREVLSVAKVVVGSTIRTDVTVAALTNGYTAAASTVTSLEFDVLVYYGSDLIEAWTQLSMLDTAVNYVETVINDDVTGSLAITATDEDAAIGEGADKPTAGTYALTGGTDETTGLVIADILGDETGRTGVHALDDIDDVSLLAIPGYSDVALVQNVIAYVEGRQDMFYIIGAPADYSRDQIVAYRQATGGFDTKYAALYWPRIKVLDPAGQGTAPKITIDPVGHILGIYGRVDNLAPPDGGVWSTPAGEGDFGAIRGALELEVCPNDNDQNILNPIGINAIRRFKASGIVVYGGRTLSNDPNWRYISVRRFFTFCEQSILKSTKSDVFRNNDFRLWARLTNKISAFLRGLWEDGAMPGPTIDESFFVKVDDTTTTPGDVAAGRLIGEIGIRPQRPAEFIIFRFSQYDGGSAVNEG